MAIRAIVFDIGGVLEITPSLGVTEKWESALRLEPGELNERLSSVWQGGSIGTLSEEEVHRGIGDNLGLSEAQVNAFMEEMWTEYLGTLNVELAEYFRGLRPRYRTAILSNSFVGARTREQERYRFEEMTDVIIYSHEVGMSKPDRRIYELTCERLGVQPEEMIFVDDVAPIVDAAREMGIQAILFKDNAQAIADIEACLGEAPR
jgi:epoxide hydrolase-like predicted phosphatase